jgi:hypothetical protein
VSSDPWSSDFDWSSEVSSLASEDESSPLEFSSFDSFVVGERLGTSVKPAAATPPNANNTTPVASTALPVADFRKLDGLRFMQVLLGTMLSDVVRTGDIALHPGRRYSDDRVLTDLAVLLAKVSR